MSCLSPISLKTYALNSAFFALIYASFSEGDLFR